MTNNKAIELLDNLLGVVEDNHGSDYDKAIHMAIDALAADVRENVRGEWIAQEDDYHHYWECSECGIGVGLDDIRNYCPNCGADMRGDNT